MLGVCVLDALARNAAETLTQFVAKNAVRGLRLLNDGRRAKTAIDDPRTFALWEVATKLGLPVCVASSIDEVSRLSTVLARFPGASIVFDEISGKDKSFPATTDRLAALVALAAHENFFVKITPEMSLVLRNEKTPPEKFYAPLVEKFGANRLMWGSHYPVRVSAFGDIAARLEAAKTDLAFLGNIERRWIFSETAFSLWPQLRA
jgi:predicted TIM-barrel fold metal-dependent hydrolase